MRTSDARWDPWSVWSRTSDQPPQPGVVATWCTSFEVRVAWLRLSDAAGKAWLQRARSRMVGGCRR